MMDHLDIHHSKKRIEYTKDDKKISEWTRKDIESVYKAVADSSYQNSIKKGLEYRGFVVDAYEDPHVALENYRPSRYAICLIDIKMPKMNGFELYHEIKKLDDGVKICFCTAFDLEYHEAFNKAFPELDEHAFIPKPSTLSTLVLRIEDELKNLPLVVENS